jgi:signal transduction histidine kinase
VINGAGYSALGRIVQEICVLPVTASIIQETYERVIREPGIAGTALPTFEVAEESNGLALRLFRNDLEDILANLLRNALAAGATTLKVILAEDDDPITGVGMVEFRLIDNAPGTLTNAMIRGRYIGRGLGLAVDIINRHEGSIRVQPGEGYKTVVVQLPRVEPASVEAEWTA